MGKVSNNLWHLYMATSSKENTGNAAREKTSGCFGTEDNWNVHEINKHKLAPHTWHCSAVIMHACDVHVHACEVKHTSIRASGQMQPGQQNKTPERGSRANKYKVHTAQDFMRHGYGQSMSLKEGVRKEESGN